MKHILLAGMMIIAITCATFSQVSISSDGTDPHNSAMLEVKSSTKGFLPPRMTHSEMAAIASPGEGLVVFCTDCGANNAGAMAMFMGGRWNTLSSNCLNPSLPIAGIHVPSSGEVVWNWNPVADASGYKWNTNTSYAGAIDIGTATTYTESGLNCNQNYTRYVWAYNSCGNSGYVPLTQLTSINPAVPSAAAATSYPTQIIWNWNPVPGATGYKWSLSNNYAGATDLGSATSKTETGLSCNQMYYRYVWAYNGCGNSVSRLLNQTTTSIPAQPVAGTHVATAYEITWNWNPVTGATGYKWSATNNFAAATDMGTATSKIESGLPCNTSQIRYIWAYSPCGNSLVTMTSQSTIKNPEAPATGIHVAAATQIVWNWLAVPGATGYKWSATNNYGTATNMGNVLTKTETGLTCNSPYARYAWAYNACGNSVAVTLVDTTSMSNIPLAPIAGTHSATTSQIVWNWNAVSGALGYKWSTTNDYTTAVNMGTALTKTESPLTCATTYTRYVWAYTSCGVSAATAMTKATVYCIWICGSPLTDNRDGKIYGTQLIGTQCWMQQNLNIGTIPSFNVPQTNNGVIEKYCLTNLTANCNTYGGLYTWDEMMNYTTSSNANPSGRQGICPTGWHIPSDDEWCELESFLDPSITCPFNNTVYIGTDAGGKMKEAGTTHWASPNTGATNSSFFTALPGGYVYNNGTGSNPTLTMAYFHTSTEFSSTNTLAHKLFHDRQDLVKLVMDKATGYSFSVRCVKD